MPNNPSVPAFGDYHVHSTFSDGKADPRTVVETAIASGLAAIGFSEHSYTPFDLDSCIALEDRQAYFDTVHALREEYAGRIRIYCGIEQDILSGRRDPRWDYAIGSVHYLHIGERYYCVDFHVEDLYAVRDSCFGGDIYAVAEAYFQSVSHVVEETGCDVIGHFDLIRKLNRRYGLFDATHPRYRAAWRRAADALLKTGKPFEINTGGVSRGHCDEPYPAEEMLTYLSERGARFLLSSDSHDPRFLAYDFSGQQARAARLGLSLISSPWD